MANIRSIWKQLMSPSPLSLAGILSIGFVGGVIFWGGFNTAMEATNTEEFCISCHEMRDNVYEEYKETIHYKNRTGVRAVCSDCHVPKEWVHKFVRKIKASRELYHKALGTISTREKFIAERERMAEKVWREMKANDSRECRNCHDFVSMDPEEQGRSAANKHKRAIKKGETCIDCHKGIAHTLPEDDEEASEDE
ncbi:MAG: Denitrification system component NirT [Gammaproteobacteria bacterium]|nr:MAG: Denitrification system component NirT [Gammaproteobacteria bacterium]